MKKLDKIHTSKLLLLLYLFYSIHFIDYVQSVVFSPNGEYLATGSGDCTVKIIETDRFEKIV